MDVSFFGEMAWKSALISGAALILAYGLRSRAASDRALVLRIGVTMLLLLPLIAVALPALPIEAWAAPEAAPPPAYVMGPEVALSSLTAPAGIGLEPSAPTIWDDPTPLMLLAYLGGLLMVGSRLLVGLLLLGRWTRAARDVTCPEWLEAFDRARRALPDGGRLRLMVSDAVPSPLSWGWRNPVILIDPDTLDDFDQAAAILAHEVAHVVRRDWPVLMLTRIAAALFWFNPLVWLLEREVVQQAEEAADCEAAACVEPVRYARTLLSWAQANGGMLPANSIAPSGSALTRRVKAVLDRRTRERPSGSAWTAIAALLCVAIAAPVAAMQLVEAARAPKAPEAPAASGLAPDAPEAPDAPDAPRAAMAPPGPLSAPAPVAPPRSAQMMMAVPDVSPAVAEALASVLPQIPRIVAEATAAAAVDPGEIGRATEEALREVRAELAQMDRIDIAAMNREIRRAVAHSQARIAPVRSAAIAASVHAAQRGLRAAPRAIAASMAHGRQGMARGADGMDAGARQMDREAAQLRDRNYREQEIRRAAARGESVTHEDLIEVADGLREGAEELRDGAREMREAAREAAREMRDED